MGPDASLAAVGGTISIIITVFFIFSVILGVIYGLKRGIFKTLIRIVTLVLSVAISIIILTSAISSIEAWIAGIPLSELVSAVSPDPLDAGTLAILESFDTQTAVNLLLLVICVIAMPIVFVVLFYILKLISLILYAILSSVLGFGGKYKSSMSRLLGAVAGAVQGAFLAIVVTVPVIGLLGMAEDAKEPLLADAPDETATVVSEFYETYLDEAIANPVYKLSRSLGGDFIFSTLTATSIEGERVVMRDEALKLATIYTDFSTMGEINWTSLTEDNKDVLITVLADIGDNRYVASTVAGVLRGIGTAVENEAIVVTLEDPIDDFATSLLTVFKDTTADTLEDDLSTFMNVYFILSDSAVLSHFSEGGEGESADDVEDLFTSKNEEGKNVIQQVIEELNKNPRTAHIVTELTKFSLKLMADSVGNALPADVDTEQLYEDVKAGISGALDSVNDSTLSVEEKKESVKTTITDTLIQSGVMTEENQLDDEIMDSITDYVVKNYEGKTELSDEDINNAILHYYEAYGNKTEPAPEVAE